MAELAAVAPPNRREWVEAAFPDDPDARAELLSLVEHLSPVHPEEGPAPEATEGHEDPWIGRSIAGCTVLGLLGVGGMGRVYEARQHATNRLVALKLLGDGAMPGFLAERLRAEGAALGALEHHNIARVYQAGVVVVDGTTSPFVVMELVARARTTGSWASSTSLGPIERIERIARCCDAVQHAHGRGIIHGDVKPANVLFGPDDEPKLIDFGTARLAGALEGGGIGSVHAITPLWAAPEQSSGTRLSASTLTDIYGLGRVASVALDEPMLRRLEGRRRRDLDAVVARATALRPEDRYPTAHALACDLRRVAEDCPASVRRQRPSEFVARLVRKHPALAAAVSAAMLAVLVAGALLYRSERSMRRAFAIGQLNQSVAALEAGNWEGAVQLSRTAQSPSALPAVLPGMVARRADMASTRVRLEGGGVVRGGTGTDRGEIYLAATNGLTRLRLDRDETPTMLTSEPSRAVAVSPDGKIVFSACDDGRVIAVDASLESLHELCRIPAGVRSIAVLGRERIALGCRDGSVQIVNLTSGDSYEVLAARGSAADNNGALVARCGHLLGIAALFDGKLVEFDGVPGSEPKTLRGGGPSPTSLVIHEETYRFTYGGANGDLAAGSIDKPESVVRRSWTTGIAGSCISGNGQYLALTMRDGTIAICDAETLEPQRTAAFGTNRAATWCSFDRTGTRLVAAVDDCVVETPVHPTYEPSVDLGTSPRGAGPSAAGTLTVWSADGSIRSVSPRTAAVAPWTGQELPFEPGSISASPTDGTVAGWSGEALVIRTPSGKAILRQLASGGKARTAWTELGDAVWAVRGGRAWLLDPQGTVLASGEVPGDSTLPSIVALPGQRAALVDVDGSCLLEREGDRIGRSPLAVRGYRAWRAEEGIAVAARDGTLRWTPLEGDADATRTFGDGSHAVTAADYSPEQQLLAVGCSDRKVRIRDFGTGELLATLGGHARPPVAVHWLEEGHVLVSIDPDGKAETWTDLPIEAVEDVTGASGSRAP